MVTPDKMMLCAGSLAAVEGIRHGFFTRQGGVSGGIYASLNCGTGSRDDAANVTENRARVAEMLGVKPTNLLSLYQKHSAMAVVVDRPWRDGKSPEADAMVTSTPGVALGVLTADCAPVLLCDGEARVIGAVHAGWRGTLDGIVEATVEAMLQLGAKRERMRAAIGPAISQKAYEVGHDYKAAFLVEEPEGEAFFITDEGSGEPHLDLPGYVAERLARAGIESIDDIGLCTYCDETRLFSYRRSQH
ncbi:MAG: peptidoglycan editing factor PgeF, partial [Methyloceanibacter sp.]